MKDLEKRRLVTGLGVLAGIAVIGGLYLPWVSVDGLDVNGIDFDDGSKILASGIVATVAIILRGVGVLPRPAAPIIAAVAAGVAGFFIYSAIDDAETAIDALTAFGAEASIGVMAYAVLAAAIGMLVLAVIAAVQDSPSRTASVEPAPPTTRLD